MADIKPEDIARALAKDSADMQESDYRAKDLMGVAGKGDLVEGELKRVLIQRGDDRVVTDVPEHEVEILQAIYSPENVEVLDEDVGTVQLPDNAEVEHARLKQKYDRKDFPVIQQLYPRGAADVAASLGMEHTGKAASSVKAGASIKVRAPQRASAKKAAAKKASR